MYNIITISKKKPSFVLNKKLYNWSLVLEFLKRERISILDLCTKMGFLIPHYCYHFSLSIAGNCRMCLIELSNTVKPVVACSLELVKTQIISLETKVVKRAREGMMEFLLVNHPLDCPVCDQGGECDLQDQSIAYGSDRGRVLKTKEKKRSVTEVMWNNFIKINLTRCIHCTRCVRFLTEIAGTRSLGMLGRGLNSEISVYTDETIISELSSNITDFCPVGALTIKTYGLEERYYGDVVLETIDLSDSLSVPLSLYTDGIKVLRVLPKFNTDLDISWITERARFLLDGVITQQLDYPSIRAFTKFISLKKIERYKPVMMATSWKNISFILLKKMKQMLFFNFNYSIGDILDLETILHIKESSLFYGYNNLKSSSERKKTKDTELLNEDFDYNYIYKNSSIQNLKNYFLINLNLRIENAILNASLRKKLIWDQNFKLYYLGSKTDLTYKYNHLGISTKSIFGLAEGRYILLKLLIIFNKIFVIVYSCVLNLCYKNEFFSLFFSLLKILNKNVEINYLAKSASSIGIMDLSFNRSIKKDSEMYNSKKILSKFEKIFFFIGCNNIKKNIFYIKKHKLAHKTFIYQNSHGDNFNLFMDYFLPVYSFLEKELGYYTNCLGILRKTRKAIITLNTFAQEHIDVIKLIQKIFHNNNLKYKIYINKKGVAKLYDYIPLHLFNNIRTFFYNIFYKKKQFSLYYYFYVLSNKFKNSYKNNILQSVYSPLTSTLSFFHYLKTSNLSL